ncbi:sensor histidine kinase [Mesonia sp.]|uniref:tetratricopeptide repeat-containing sensor histidine kinase n=1 Tax=Mesonia sp. TaxID=1960830 RepID=UPI00177127A5|nr:sensor histidine kinase [Mesonia sp.]HIB38605.1 tetratricopeptide repeat protein [Mesonia sp.]HIO26100.1 tetratricopeptide repeat protein [Flavobacteriaceae bacterium]
MKKNFITNIILILLCLTCWGQSQDFSKIEEALQNYELDQAKKLLLQQKIIDFEKIDKGKHYYFLAEVYSAKDKSELALENYIKAKKLFVEENAESNILDCNLALLGIINNQEGIDNNFESIEKEINDYIAKQDDPKAIYTINNRIASNYLDSDDNKKAIEFFYKNVELGNRVDQPKFKALAFANISTVHSILTRNQDSALYYNNNSIKFLLQNPENNEIVSHLYNNRARIFQELGNYSEALKFYTKADSINLRENVGSTKRIYYNNLANLYEEMEDYENALNYYKKEKVINDSINQTEQNIAISEIQTKYETEKKEKENAFLKNDIEKKKQTQLILWVVVILSIIIGAGISILIAKSAKRKQLVAKQKEKIRIQKIEKDLKEQELNSIDVLIAGQEKERQRLAENLHDNLGGTLAALKLNIQNLEQNQDNPNITEKSIKNSLNLIDDAYHSVRNMAHEKSHGVIASQGLLPAIKNFTQNISNEKLKIEIEHFGLKNRLDNSLEIRIFRIIQELVTNIIKHAEASEASISLTNHNSTLNIIVEDNGKGFTNNSKKRGVGIATIEKRIENLGGTLEIDSNPNRGSSIIINLPL